MEGRAATERAARRGGAGRSEPPPRQPPPAARTPKQRTESQIRVEGRSHILAAGSVTQTQADATAADSRRGDRIRRATRQIHEGGPEQRRPTTEPGQGEERDRRNPSRRVPPLPYLGAEQASPPVLSGDDEENGAEGRGAGRELGSPPESPLQSDAGACFSELSLCWELS